MANIKIIFFGLFLALCFSLPWLPASASDTMPETSKPEQKIVISAQQYNNWKAQLTALELNLEQLKRNSNEDKERIAKLEQLLQTSNEAMNKAQGSLMIADKDYQSLKSNLQILTEQTELLERTNKRLERQRNTWAIVAGSMLVLSITNQ